MPDNKLQILERLQAGEITADEALVLMNQTPDSPDKPQPGSQPGSVDPRQINPNKTHHHEAHSQSHHDYHDHHDPSQSGGLFGWISDVVESVTSEIKDMDIDVNVSDFFRGNLSHNKHTVNFTSQPILQNLSQLELHGKNDRVEIHGYDGNTIQIQCHYNARYPDAHVSFHEENGCVALLFNDKEMRSVQVLCQVPHVQIEHLIAETRNARIHLVDVTAKEISLNTKNDNIYLEEINCDHLAAHSRNGNIKARVISGGEILLETTNSKITAEDIHAHSLMLKTTNAGIKTAALDAVNLVIKTTNTGLKLEDTLQSSGPLFWDGERSLEAYTTNSGIRFLVPDGIGFNLEAGTTGGKVTCDVPLYGAEGSRTYVKGESINYATSGRRLNVRLQTTNASIKVRGM